MGTKNTVRTAITSPRSLGSNGWRSIEFVFPMRNVFPVVEYSFDSNGMAVIHEITIDVDPGALSRMLNHFIDAKVIRPTHKGKEVEAVEPAPPKPDDGTSVRRLIRGEAP